MAEIPFLVIREENFVEVKAHEESLVEIQEKKMKKKKKGEESTQQQWDKFSQVEIQ